MPGEAADVVDVHFTPGQLTYTTHLQIHSNGTSLQVPLVVYHGHLTATAAVYPDSFAELALPDDGGPPLTGMPPPPPRSARHNHVPRAVGSPLSSSTASAQPHPPGMANPQDPLLLASGAGGTDASRPAGVPLTVRFKSVAVGAPRRAIFNVTNPNPLPLRITSIAVTAALRGTLRLVLQTVRNDRLAPVDVGGSAQPFTYLPLDTIDGMDADGGLVAGDADTGTLATKSGGRPGGSSSASVAAVAANTPHAMLTVPPRGRAIFAGELEATHVGSLKGAIELRVEAARKHNAHLLPASTLTMLIEAEAVNGGVGMMSAATNQSEVTQQLDLGPSMGFLASHPGTTRRLPVIATSTLTVPIKCVDMAAAFSVGSERSMERAMSGRKRSLAALATDNPLMFVRLMSNVTIAPNESRVIAWVELDTTRMLSDTAALEHLSEPFYHMAPGTPLDRRTVAVLSRRRQRWAELEAIHRNEVASDAPLALEGLIRLDTNVVRNVTIPVLATFAWPALARSPTLDVGSTPIGASSASFVKIRNPTNSTIWAQLLDPSDDAPLSEHAQIAEATPAAAVASLVRLVPLMPSAFALSAAARAPVLVPPLAEASLGPITFRPRHSGEVLSGNEPSHEPPFVTSPPLPTPSRATPRLVHPEGLVRWALVTPGGTHRACQVRAWLFVRNNATLLDDVLIHGVGAAEGLEFVTEGVAAAAPVAAVASEASAAAAGSDVGDPPAAAAERWLSLPALAVTVDKSELACASAAPDGGSDGAISTASDVVPSVTRTFRLKNRASVPVTTRGTLIDGRPCEASGLRVLHGCARNLTVLPGHTATLELQYDPDFTVASFSVPLLLQTSVGGVSIAVHARVPRTSLGPCVAERRQRLAATPVEVQKRSSTGTVLLILFGILAQLVAAELLRAPPASSHRKTAQLGEVAKGGPEVGTALASAMALERTGRADARAGATDGKEFVAAKAAAAEAKAAAGGHGGRGGLNVGDRAAAEVLGEERDARRPSARTGRVDIGAMLTAASCQAGNADMADLCAPDDVPAPTSPPSSSASQATAAAAATSAPCILNASRHSAATGSSRSRPASSGTPDVRAANISPVLNASPRPGSTGGGSGTSGGGGSRPDSSAGSSRPDSQPDLGPDSLPESRQISTSSSPTASPHTAALGGPAPDGVVTGTDAGGKGCVGAAAPTRAGKPRATGHKQAAAEAEAEATEAIGRLAYAEAEEAGGKEAKGKEPRGSREVKARDDRAVEKGGKPARASVAKDKEKAKEGRPREDVPPKEETAKERAKDKMAERERCAQNASPLTEPSLVVEGLGLGGAGATERSNGEIKDEAHGSDGKAPKGQGKANGGKVSGGKDGGGKDSSGKDGGSGSRFASRAEQGAAKEAAKAETAKVDAGKEAAKREAAKVEAAKAAAKVEAAKAAAKVEAAKVAAKKAEEAARAKEAKEAEAARKAEDLARAKAEREAEKAKRVEEATRAKATKADAKAKAAEARQGLPAAVPGGAESALGGSRAPPYASPSALVGSPAASLLVGGGLVGGDGGLMGGGGGLGSGRLGGVLDEALEPLGAVDSFDAGLEADAVGIAEAVLGGGAISDASTGLAAAMEAERLRMRAQHLAPELHHTRHAPELHHGLHAAARTPQPSLEPSSLEQPTLRTPGGFGALASFGGDAFLRPEVLLDLPGARHVGVIGGRPNRADLPSCSASASLGNGLAAPPPPSLLGSGSVNGSRGGGASDPWLGSMASSMELAASAMGQLDSAAPAFTPGAAAHTPAPPAGLGAFGAAPGGLASAGLGAGGLASAYTWGHFGTGGVPPNGAGAAGGRADSDTAWGEGAASSKARPYSIW